MDEVILDVDNWTHTGNYEEDEISDIQVVEMARKSLGLGSLLSNDQFKDVHLLEGDDGLLMDSDDILLKDSVRFPSVINEIKRDTSNIDRHPKPFRN
jgi:hypothetical protein